MNLAALVEYDGTDFVGFQRQAADKGRTVQGAIEAALARIAGEAIRIEAAGRTDSGVHATGQVINFHVSRLDPATWQQALNALLPPDVAVRAICPVGDEFRARWSALSRSYRYRIFWNATRAPLRERYAWRVPQPLDVAAMDAAAAVLLGEHDFGAFGSSPSDQRGDAQKRHTVRMLHEANCEQRLLSDDGGQLDEIVCCFTANAFLSGMVRRLVGTLALVGMRRLTVADFRQILEARDKVHPGTAAPAQGLCLARVAYPDGMLTWN